MRNRVKEEAKQAAADSEDGNSMFLGNIDRILQKYTA
jgi:hypothetical protein